MVSTLGPFVSTFMFYSLLKSLPTKETMIIVRGNGILCHVQHLNLQESLLDKYRIHTRSNTHIPVQSFICVATQQLLYSTAFRLLIAQHTRTKGSQRNTFLAFPYHLRPLLHSPTTYNHLSFGSGLQSFFQLGHHCYSSLLNIWGQDRRKSVTKQAHVSLRPPHHLRQHYHHSPRPDVSELHRPLISAMCFYFSNLHNLLRSKRKTGEQSHVQYYVLAL